MQGITVFGKSVMISGNQSFHLCGKKHTRQIRILYYRFDAF